MRYRIIKPHDPLDAIPGAGDTVLPAQWFAARRGGLDPCERLWMAVVEDAIDCACTTGSSGRARKRRAEARYWLFDDDAEQRVGSFANVCATLGLDADWWRAHLRTLIESGKRRARHHDGYRRDLPVTATRVRGRRAITNA